MPTRLTASPAVLTASSWFVFISGGSMSRWTASKTIKTEMSIRKMPFAKPDSVSTRAYLQRHHGVISFLAIDRFEDEPYHCQEPTRR